MGGRRAFITQVEIGRTIRAAKQAGAAEIEIRVTGNSTILIRIEASAHSLKAVEQDHEIVL